MFRDVQQCYLIVLAYGKTHQDCDGLWHATYWREHGSGHTKHEAAMQVASKIMRATAQFDAVARKFTNGKGDA